MIPVVSDLLEDILRPLVRPIIRIIPVINCKIDELHPKVNHEYVHNNPDDQSRDLPQSIDQHSEDIDDYY